MLNNEWDQTAKALAEENKKLKDEIAALRQEYDRLAATVPRWIVYDGTETTTPPPWADVLTESVQRGGKWIFRDISRFDERGEPLSCDPLEVGDFWFLWPPREDS